jgi:hypothetical protein
MPQGRASESELFSVGLLEGGVGLLVSSGGVTQMDIRVFTVKSCVREHHEGHP